MLIVRNPEKLVVMKYHFQKENSGVVGNFRQGVRLSVAFLPIHLCSALPFGPKIKKSHELAMNRLYDYEQLRVTGHGLSKYN